MSIEVELKASFSIDLCEKFKELILKNFNLKEFYDFTLKEDIYYKVPTLAQTVRIRKNSSIYLSAQDFDICDSIKRFIFGGEGHRSLPNLNITETKVLTIKQKHVDENGIEENEEIEYIIPYDLFPLVEAITGLSDVSISFKKTKKALGFYLDNELHCELVKVQGLNTIFLEVEAFSDTEDQVGYILAQIKAFFSELGIQNFENKSWEELLKNSKQEENNVNSTNS